MRLTASVLFILVLTFWKSLIDTNFYDGYEYANKKNCWCIMMPINEKYLTPAEANFSLEIRYLDSRG